MRRYSRAMGMAIACSAIALLAGCDGGGGGGNSGGGGGVVTPPPAPTPSPTPTPTPTGSIATVSEGAIPEVGANDIAIDYQVTNRGLYFQFRPEDEDEPTRIVKLHGDPTSSNAWTSTTPDDDAGALVVSFAPSNIASEDDRAVAYYWASFAFPSPDKWGHYTMNTGGVSTEAEVEDDAFSSVYKVVSGAVNGTVAPRSWMIKALRNGSDGFEVYQDDGAYTSANTLGDRFSTPATPVIPYEPTVAVAHPEDPHLYVGAGDGLYVYDADRLVRSWDMPDSLFSFSDLIWYQGDLFVGYNDTVYRLEAGSTTLRPVATLPVLSLGLSGRFCVAGGEIFLTDGTAVNIQTGASRDWIRKGTLTSTQSTAADILMASLSGGIYCSAQSLSPVIYSPFVTTTGTTIRMITPVP